ncbi:Pyrroline-5-carboxylate reductase [uncultured Comamonas sp.]|nr:Pyrroline-5-carboxylate reductase [uncultured Comamonas sp.]
MTTSSPSIAFIGGGNMASAIIGGLLRQGWPASAITVVEPFAAARSAAQQQGLAVFADAPSAQAALAQAQVVVWAVKPQSFAEAAAPVAPFAAHALHLSVAAGIPTASIARWLGTQRVVRAMPNTPALIGQGMSGLFACPQVDAAGRQWVEQIMAGTGRHLWVQEEAQLDAVTALSGSGPAYVFLLLEAMTQAGAAMGLTAAQSYELAVATFQGASALAAQSSEDVATLRQRVTSKGGTTHAAITHMQATHIPENFIAALQKAQQRAQELAAEFGA